MKTNTLDFDAQALREKILDLAMRGKLVPQDPNDEPASVLLEKIKAEKEQLIKEKKIKKKDWNLPEKHKTDNLPQGWQKTSLKEITTPFTLNDGDWILSKNMIPYSDVKLIQLGSIGEGKYIDKGFKYISQDTFDELNCTEIKPGYLLINRLINKQKMMATILPKIEGKLITAVDICWIAPSSYFNQEFMMYQLLSPAFQNKVNKLTSGSTRKRISKGNLTSIELFLPPLEEQSRIAAKIAQLFALLRKVESSTQQYAKLQTLLKSTVLDLAMRGKLVEQDPHDEPASVLLERIKTEKEQLVKKGKIRKSKSLPPITEDEKLFNLPQGWTWVKLNDVLALENGAIRRGPFGSSLKKSFFVPKSEDTYKVYEQGNAINHTINYGSYYISYQKYEELQSFSIRPGDIIISGAGTIGKTYILPSNSPKGVINQALIRVRLNEQLISKEYFLFAFKQKVGLINKQAKGTAIKNMFSVTHMKNDLVWALPPLAEQKRITKKIQNILSFVK